MDTLLRKSQWSGLRQRILEHLRTPLYRNGYALIAGSVFTSGIGFFYWVIAARIYTPEIFGINATLISTMTFLSNIANLNLGSLLVRFIPGSGKRLPRLVITIYCLSIVIALIATGIFLLVQPIWASKLTMLQTDPIFVAWFVISTALWCVFVLEDSVLTGLRQAIWVPFENLTFSLLKVVLLFALAATAAESIFWSWTLPNLLLVPLITLLLFGRLIPRQVKAQPETTTPLSLRTGVRFAGNDFIGSLIGQALGSLLPLFVLAKLGAAQAGYLSVAMMVSTSLNLVTSNIGSSLLAEAAADETRLADYSYKALMHTLRLLVPAVLLFVVGAPLLLEMFGKAFTAQATLLLQLMCLSALPTTVNTLRSNIQRVRMKTGTIVVQIVAISGITVSVAFMLVGRMGINAIGVAWLAGQGIVALVLLLTDMRPLWMGRLNIARLIAVRQDVRARLSGRGREARRLAESHLPEVLGQVELQSGLSGVSSWGLRGAQGNASSVVCRLGPASGAEAILKLTAEPMLTVGLNRRCQAVQDVWANSALKSWRPIVPRVLAHGSLEGAGYLVETLMPGINGVEALAQGAPADQLLRSAAEAIRPLHRLTAREAAVDDGRLDEWVNRRAEVVRVGLSQGAARGALPALDKLVHALSDRLRGREMTTSWIHGNYVPGNFLVDPASYATTGIVDWELAQHDALPQVELMWLIMAMRLHSQGLELGHIIVNILSDRGDGLTELEREMLVAEGPSGLATRELVELAWLAHVAANLAREMEHYSNNWFWIFKNVESVLYYL